MNLRFLALAFACGIFGLIGCSGQKPIPDRYRAETIYPPIQTPLVPPAAPQIHPTSGSEQTQQRSWAQAEAKEPIPSPPPQAPGKKPESETKPEPKIDVASLPFAIPVPDQPNVVTLPDEMGFTAEIDVTGIEPGTAVEIPDPNHSGETIQFRVPGL